MIEFITNFFNSLKLNARFNLFIVSLLIFIFTMLGWYLYNTQKQEIFNKTEKQLIVLLEDLIDIFTVQTTLKRDEVNTSIKYIEKLINLQGGIIESDSAFLNIAVTIPLTNQMEVITLNKWKLGNKDVHFNNSLIDDLNKDSLEAVATIYQKTPNGYLRIATTMLNSDSTRAVNTLLSDSTSVIATIESGESYYGRHFDYDNWYISVYKPIIIDGEVKGMLFLGFPQIDYEILKEPIFYKKRYLQTGYPYVVSSDGISLINVTKIEGTDLNGTSFFRNLVNTKKEKKEKFRYKWPENHTGEWKWTYFKYFDDLEIYIATSIFEEELYSGLEKLKNGIIIGVIIAIILFYAGISLIIRPITSSIKKLVAIISAMSRGRIVEKIYYRRTDEIGNIIVSINTLIKGLSETAKFSKEIEKGNFESKFTPLSNKDMLGNSLLDMRRSLKNAKEEEQKRKAEDDKRSWASEGLTMFGELLQHNTNDLTKLSDNLTKEITQYLKANQTGLFILNEENHDDMFLELVSAYAYSRKKFHKRNYKIGEGLIGTCAIEKQSIHLREIPDGYISIESGLGTANPSTILIVPLKLEGKVLGVVEIATFREFDEHEVTFVEKLGENIASTLSTVRINARTAVLLRESQKQAKEISLQKSEMQENLEELSITQQESARRQAEMSGVLSALDTSFFVAELSLDGKIIKMNDAFIDIFKSDREHIIGKNSSDLIALNDEQKNGYKELWKELRNGNSGKQILSLKIKDQEIWLSETYTPIVDNNGVPYKVLNIAVDITQSKLQEIEIQDLLKDSRRKARKLTKQEKLNSYNIEKLEKTQNESARKELEMREILEALDNTVIRTEFTVEGIYSIVNEHHEKITGYPKDDVIGENIRLFIPSDEIKDFDAIWANIMEGNNYEATHHKKTKNGADIWLLESYTPVSDRKKNITKILYLANDITRQKQIEHKMQKQSLKLLEKNRLNHKTVKEMLAIQLELDIKKSEMQAITKIFGTNSYIINYNADGNIIQINDYALQKIKQFKTDIIGKKYCDVPQLSNVENKDACEKLFEELKNGQIINKSECSIKDGKTICTIEMMIPVFGSNKKLLKILHIIQEVESQN